MNLVFKIVLLFAVAIVIAALCTNGPGHVIIFIYKYRIDLSLTTLILTVLLGYIILHYSSRFIAGIYHLPFNIRKYRQKMARARNRNYFNLAATDYFQGKYKHAYNNALKSIRQPVSVANKFPVLLLAIDSVHLMDDTEKGTSVKLDKLITNFSSKSEQEYLCKELTDINLNKNSRFYAEVLTKLKLFKADVHTAS